MLRTHMDATERALVATSQIPEGAGHSLHKGTPREAFVRQFLESHLPANVAIGTGEIIDADSRPGESRNQFDIVIYKRSYPKLDFGGDTSGFLVESVIATIEVKSRLTKQDLETAVAAAHKSKSLVPSVHGAFHAGYLPPKLLNYVVAYAGPASMKTVYKWIPKIHESLGISVPDLPLDENRTSVASPSIDGIFVLERGFAYFDNVPVGFVSEEARQAHPDLKWLFCDTQSGNLLLLFILLHQATANVEGRWLDPIPYLEGFELEDAQFGLR